MSDAGRRARFADAADVDDVRSPLWEEAVAAGAARGALVPVDGERAGDAEPLAEGDGDGSGLRRYARWQWGDFWRTRGLWIAGFALLVIAAVWYRYDPAAAREMYRGRVAYDPNGWWAHRYPTFDAWTGGLLRGAFATFAVLAAVAATFGVVSHERERGLQRFVFAKPVALTRYYLQKLGIAGAGFLVVMAVVAAVAALAFAAPLQAWALAVMAVCTFVAVGGLTFLLSTLTRVDGPAALALLVAAMPATAVAFSTRSVWAPVGRLAQLLLPPFQALSVLGGAEGQYAVIYPVAVAWSLAYGVACVAAGVWVLRRRSITT